MNTRETTIRHEVETRQHLIGLRNELALTRDQIRQRKEAPDADLAQLAERLLQFVTESGAEPCQLSKLNEMRDTLVTEIDRILPASACREFIKSHLAGIITFAATLEELRAELTEPKEKLSDET